VFIEYKQVRNRVRSESRCVAQRAQQQVAYACKENRKKFWQYVKSKSKTTAGLGDIKVCVNNINKILTKDVDKAEEFSAYFSSIFKNEPGDPFDKLPQVVSPGISSLSFWAISLGRQHMFADIWRRHFSTRTVLVE